MPYESSKHETQPQRTSSLLRTYKRAVLWRKVMLFCFSLVFIAIMFWAIPWLPYGLSVEDYDRRVTLLVGLMILASITAFGAVYHRDLSRRVEQTLATWTTIHDGLGDLRRREYFYDRIVIECDRAASNGSQFTVITMRLDVAGKDDKTVAQLSERALGILLPTVKDSDCLAVLGPREIGMLAPDIDVKQAPAFAEGLRGQIVEGMPDTSAEIRVGWAVYGVDAMEAGGLVGHARERLQGKHRPAEGVAALEADAALEPPDYPATA